MLGCEDSLGSPRSWQSHGAKLATTRSVDVVDTTVRSLPTGNYAEDGCQQISKKNSSINVFSHQCTYQFILIFLLASSITRLLNEILLNYFTVIIIELA